MPGQPSTEIMQDHALNLLQHVQQQLQGIYDIDVGYDIRQFTITDRIIAEAIDNRKPRGSEQLLIKQQDDCLDISLFLDRTVLDELHTNNPFTQLHQENLKPYWLAVEGVSHFLYIAWRAGFDRQVSQLELELQAEIDKFVCASELLARQNSTIDSHALWTCLFKNFYLHKHLNTEQTRRYLQANEYAAEYCNYITSEFVQQRKVANYYQQLRRFYRLGQQAKMAHISAAH